jgi:hypothetical protein
MASFVIDSGDVGILHVLAARVGGRIFHQDF